MISQLYRSHLFFRSGEVWGKGDISISYFSIVYTLTEELENQCSILYTADVCAQPKTMGPCRGNFSRWYYDQDLRMCQEFAFGGCHGNRNNFLTESECQHQCLQPGKSRGKC